MSSLHNIPVRVELVPSPDDVSIAKSIMHEILNLMGRLLTEGDGGVIDLRGLPAINSASLGMLEKWLSLGEVSAEVKGIGRTTVRETSYPGVWWLVYHNEKGDLVTESIQVAQVPNILISPREDIELGMERLNRMLAADH